MSVMFVLIFISIATALVFLIAFVWAVRTGQFDDDYTPSIRILPDEPGIQKNQNSDSINQTPSSHAAGKI